MYCTVLYGVTVVLGVTVYILVLLIAVVVVGVLLVQVILLHYYDNVLVVCVPTLKLWYSTNYEVLLLYLIDY